MIDAPDGLLAALAGAAVTGSWREGARGYGRAEGGLFVRWSSDPADEPVLDHEAAVRDMIGAEGPLRCPPVLARGPGWLVERAVPAVAPPTGLAGSDDRLAGPAEPLVGPAAVDAVVEAAAALAPRRLPSLVAAGRGGGRLGAVRRRLRLLRGPVARDLVVARRLLARSPLPLVTSHGDFHAGNLLMEGGRPWVVDWELVGRRPAAYDLMQLWPTLSDAADRERLLERVVELVGDRRSVLEMRYVLVVRTIASKLAPSADFNADPAGARELLALLPTLRAAL